MSKNRIKVPAVVIRSRAEMETLSGQIASLKIEQQRTTAEMDAAIEGVRARYAPALSALAEQIDTQMEMSRLWAEANPAEFGKNKSIDMTSAVIGFRTGQPQLKTLTGWTWDRVLEMLTRKGLTQFLRVKTEVDKQGLLAARESLGADELRKVGVRVIQEETFYVEPKLTQVELREAVEVSAA